MPEDDSFMESVLKNDSHVGEHIQIRLIGWKWVEVQNNISLMGFILLCGLAKLGFHRAHVISSRVPESCLLIILGILFGGMLSVFYDDQCPQNQRCIDYSWQVFPKFTPQLFFLFLLPPIVLEAAYSLHNEHFFLNIRSILCLAVVGTIINFLLTGGLLILVKHLGWIVLDSNNSLSTIEILLFASLISAVDPVAVLSIFQEVGINPDLYFLVFGESLLNDGVAVVLYNMMSVFAGMESKGIEVTSFHILLGCASFFTVAFGGLVIGLLYGFLTALITRLTSGVRIIEPLALLGGAYMAYITAELFQWSGIISLIGCGIIQAHYAFKNISAESLTTVNYFIKMLSSVSDCIIFLYLGMAFFEEHVWNTGFVCWTLVFILAIRFLTIYGLSFIINFMRKNIHPICLKEQFIMAYGGLRGAVGFSLVSMVNHEHVPAAQMFVTTTLAVVMFTVFLQGGTVKMFVNRLHIDRKGDEHASLTEEINHKVFEHVMEGIEIICGKHGKFYTHHVINHIDDNYLKKWFCVKNYDHTLQKVFGEVTLGDHFLHLYGPSMISKDNVNNIRRGGQQNEAFSEERNMSEQETMLIKGTPAKDERPSLKNEIKRYEDTNWLKRAFKHNPATKLHHVYDKNLVNVDHTDINLHLQKRRESAAMLKGEIRKLKENALKNASITGSFTEHIEPEELPSISLTVGNIDDKVHCEVSKLLDQHHALLKENLKSVRSARPKAEIDINQATIQAVNEKENTSNGPHV